MLSIDRVWLRPSIRWPSRLHISSVSPSASVWKMLVLDASCVSLVNSSCAPRRHYPRAPAPLRRIARKTGLGIWCCATACQCLLPIEFTSCGSAGTSHSRPVTSGLLQLVLAACGAPQSTTIAPATVRRAGACAVGCVTDEGMVVMHIPSDTVCRESSGSFWSGGVAAMLVADRVHSLT